ncbi:MAG: helix-turn-helix transcriptional regulator [Candidatus Methanomethylophilaceae archaeon]|jgi:putative transcriptional regulator|nr:helix-turn-helix transcriptional regulator [Candidatus Methanomethylophilaceae archaeon]
MPIVIRLDHVMLDKKITLVELSKRVGITNVNLSKLKTGKVSAIRLSTLEAICDVLDCQPGDLLEFRREEGGDEESYADSETLDSTRRKNRCRQRFCRLFLI